MVDTLEILDLAKLEQIQLSLVDDAGNRTSAPPVNFPFPLTDAELAELAWLLNGYPSEPYGESGSRAEVAVAGMRDLGRLLMETVFRSSPEANAIWSSVLSDQPRPFRISIVSSR